MSKAAKGKSQQASQSKMLADALKQPGVAAAVEAYGRVQGVAQIGPPASSVHVGYATGGNAS